MRFQSHPPFGYFTPGAPEAMGHDLGLSAALLSYSEAAVFTPHSGACPTQLGRTPSIFHSRLRGPPKLPTPEHRCELVRLAGGQYQPHLLAGGTKDVARYDLYICDRTIVIYNRPYLHVLSGQ